MMMMRLPAPSWCGESGSRAVVDVEGNRGVRQLDSSRIRLQKQETHLDTRSKVARRLLID